MTKEWMGFRGQSLLDRKQELIKINYYVLKISHNIKYLDATTDLKENQIKKRLREIIKDIIECKYLVKNFSEKIEKPSGKRKYTLIIARLEELQTTLELKATYIKKGKKYLNILIELDKMYQKIKYDERKINKAYIE